MDSSINPTSAIRLLKKEYPGVYYDLNGTPPLNPNYLGAILKEFELLATPEERKDRTLYIGIAIFILDNNAFRGMRSLSRGLRTPLSLLLKVDSTAISHSFRKAKGYFMFNATYRNRFLALVKLIRTSASIVDPKEEVSWYFSLCPRCMHFSVKTLSCSAYPDRIPKEYLTGENEHRTWRVDQIGLTTFEETK